jgi:hypothetical protein
MALLETVRSALANDWNFQWNREKSSIVMTVSDEGTRFVMVIKINEQGRTMTLMLKYPINAPPQTRLTMTRLFSRSGFAITCGNLEMDEEDGECQYRHFVDVEGVYLPPKWIGMLVRRHISYGIQLWPSVNCVINGGSAEQAWQLYENR